LTSVEVTTSRTQLDLDVEPRWLLETSEDDDPDTTVDPPELTPTYPSTSPDAVSPRGHR